MRAKVEGLKELLKAAGPTRMAANAAGFVEGLKQAGYTCAEARLAPGGCSL